MPDGELMKDSEHKVKETRIINKGDEVAILPAGGMGSHSEASLKSNLGDKLRTLADMLEDENYDNLRVCDLQIRCNGITGWSIKTVSKFQKQTWCPSN